MSKITHENYINIYKEKRKGKSSIDIGKKYGIDRIKVKLKGLSPVSYRLQSSN